MAKQLKQLHSSQFCNAEEIWKIQIKVQLAKTAATSEYLSIAPLQLHNGQDKIYNNTIKVVDSGKVLRVIKSLCTDNKVAMPLCKPTRDLRRWY